MELKPGYKQTEVGVIPEDWDVLTLSELCSNICDGTHYTPKYVPQGIPFYSVENITANDFTNTKFISEQEHIQLIKRCKPERGDILMTRITAGIVGDTRIIDWDVNASIYVSLALLKLNKRVAPEYLYRYSKSSSFVRDVERRALVNATPKKINMSDIGAIPIPTPRLPSEQKAIATALSDIDNLLGVLDRLIAKKQNLKQSAMQELLTGKKRLSGFGKGKSYKETEIGLIPEDWEVSELRNIVDFWDGQRKPIKNSDREKMRGSFPYYGASGIIDYVNNYIFDDNLILLGEDGENIISRSSRLVFQVTGKIWVNNHAHVLKPKPNVDINFLTEYLESLNYEEYNTGTAQPKLNQKVCSLITILLPPFLEQKAIANILSDMDTEIAALKKRRDKIRNIKQAMMQELLTGKTRLVKAEEN